MHVSKCSRLGPFKVQFQGLEFDCRVQGGLGFRVSGLGSGFRVCRVSRSGFPV